MTPLISIYIDYTQLHFYNSMTDNCCHSCMWSQSPRFLSPTLFSSSFLVLCCTCLTTQDYKMLICWSVVSGFVFGSWEQTCPGWFSLSRWGTAALQLTNCVRKWSSQDSPQGFTVLFTVFCPVGNEAQSHSDSYPGHSTNRASAVVCYEGICPKS